MATEITQSVPLAALNAVAKELGTRSGAPQPVGENPRRVQESAAARPPQADGVKAQVAGQAEKEDQEPDKETLTQAIQDINATLDSSKRRLEFEVDDASGRTVVRVMDSDTDEVIRQIPPKEVLAILRQVRERTSGDGPVSGLMFKSSA